MGRDMYWKNPAPDASPPGQSGVTGVIVVDASSRSPSPEIRAAHIAGLKEALEIVKREAVGFGTIGDGLGDLLAEAAIKGITARIKELEGQ